MHLKTLTLAITFKLLETSYLVWVTDGTFSVGNNVSRSVTFELDLCLSIQALAMALELL